MIWLAAMLGALVGVLVAEALSRVEVEDWIEANRDDDSEYAYIVAERLRTGDYKVVTGVFEGEECTVAHEWKAQEIEGFEDVLGEENGVFIEL